MVKDFVFYLKKMSFNAKLYLAGSFDDLGEPFLSKNYRTGEFFYCYNNLLRSIPNEFKKKIIYLGFLSQEELRCVYNSCDYYMNLSVHNDEDYGMSPAEALCCGLPCILTDWGGYTSFFRSGHEDFCRLIPVKINHEKKSYNKKVFIKTMLKSRKIE